MPKGTSIFGLLNALQSSHISVYQHRCAVVRNKNASCMRCAQACTSGCIHFENDELVISPERCIGCGTCATVCPTCALEAHNPNDAKLFTQCVDALRANNNTLVIACNTLIEAAQGHIDPGKVVGVRCLGRVEESLLVLLASVGAQKIILVASNCSSCNYSTGHEAATQVVKSAQALLDAWGAHTQITLTEKFPSSVRLVKRDIYDPNRRKFLDDIKNTGKTTGSIAVNHIVEEKLNIQLEQPKYVRVGADKTLPHFIPGRRKRLLEALKSYGQPPEALIETRLWGHVIIDKDQCDGCQMCATFCPTGAIRKFQSEDGTFGVEHVALYCVKCRCCTDICHTNALQLSNKVSTHDISEAHVERYAMKPRKYKNGDLRDLTSRVKDLTGVEEVYDH